MNCVEVVEWIYENGSGKILDRGMLQKAVGLCSTTGATLVTATVDRLARNVQTTLRVVDSVEVLVAEFPWLDIKTADGKFVLSLFASVAAWYADKQSEKMKFVEMRFQMHQISLKCQMKKERSGMKVFSEIR